MAEFIKFIFSHYYNWPRRRRILVYFILFLYGLTVSYLYDVLSSSPVELHYFAFNAELFIVPGYK